MKSLKYSGLLFTLLMLSVINLKAQEQNLSKTERILNVQTGSATLVNGEVTIVLNERAQSCLNNKKNMSSSYVVALTPHDTPIALAVANKSNQSFTIKSSAGNNAEVEYIIYVKMTEVRPAMSSAPSNPSK